MRCTAISLIVVAGCGAKEFDLDQPIVEQRAQGSPMPAPLAVLAMPLELDQSEKIKMVQTQPIDSVTLASLELKITATAWPEGDADDWSFVDEIHVFVKSSGRTLPRVEIAHVTAPGAVMTMTFECDSSVDLYTYANEGDVIEVETRGSLPPDDVTYDGKGVFTVHPM